MRATDNTGGCFELRHAVRSGNDILKSDAAEYLARRGARSGVHAMLELCYKYPDGHLKFSPQMVLQELIPGNTHLDSYDNAEQWWSALSSKLTHIGGGRWRLEP